MYLFLILVWYSTKLLVDINKTTKIYEQKDSCHLWGCLKFLQLIEISPFWKIKKNAEGVSTLALTVSNGAVAKSLADGRISN